MNKFFASLLLVLLLIAACRTSEDEPSPFPDVQEQPAAVPSVEATLTTSALEEATETAPGRNCPNPNAG